MATAGLFAFHVEAGMSIAGLYTLVSTCEARGIKPFVHSLGEPLPVSRCVAE